MPAWRFVAVNPAGQVIRGEMDGQDEAQVIASLRRAGNTPMRAEPAAKADLASLFSLELGRKGLSRQEVANFTRELAIMLGAGQDLDQALRFFAANNAHQPRVARQVEALRQAVRDGGSLAAALTRQPKNFSRMYVGLVRAGEAGGALAATLNRLAVLLERQRRLNATVISAMIYPALLSAVAVASVTLLLTVVLPHFVPLFAQNGAPMPASLAALLGAGAATASYGPYAVAALIGLGFFVRHRLRDPAARLKLDALLLRQPLLGPLLREILAARFTRTLGSLLLNGVPLIAALDIVRDAIGNRAAEAAVQKATLSAKSGAGLAKPLAGAKIFPARTTQLLQLGEQTGQLGDIALRAADIHDEAVQVAVQRLVAMLVPAITIVMGVVVGGIVSTLMLAMLSLNNLAG